MWTIDSRCSQCSKKSICTDRTTILTALVTLSHTLGTVPANVDGPGDGIIVMVCNDLQV